MLREIAFVLTLGTALAAQVDGPAAFDVASIKSAAPNQRAWGWSTEPGGRFNAHNLTVKQMVAVAYGVQDFQVSGADGWMASDKWDIQARAETDAKLSTEQTRRPFTALLADRFHLKAHIEKRPETAYSIGVAKDGPKMPKATEESRSIGFGAGFINGKQVSMDRLAGVLAIVMERPVVDRTGLEGNFAVYMEWTPQIGEGAQLFPTQPDAGLQRGGSIFSAIQEQLGLRLDSSKQMVDVVVVESAGKASAN